MNMLLNSCELHDVCRYESISYENQTGINAKNYQRLLKLQTICRSCKLFKCVLSKFPKALITIYDLAMESTPSIWTKVHREVFEDMKARLLKPLVSNLPDNEGSFQLFSHTSNTAAGSGLLIGHAVKMLSPSAVNYLITELELIGLCVNINQFKHLLAK